MKISIVKKNINPKTPNYLSGQINRISKHTGILDDLFCTALVIEHESIKLCLLSYDLLQFDESLSHKIRENISIELGINIEYIFTVCSHTHAACEVLKDGLFGIKTESSVSEAYLELLLETSIYVAHQANNTLQTINVEYAEIEIEGYYGNRNNINKPSDKAIRFLLFKQTDKIIGIFVNLACHPTILGPQNTLISADLIGAIRSGLEDRYKCPIFMSNGAEGDISNRHYRKRNDSSELIRTSHGILNQIPKHLNTKALEIKKLELHSKNFIFKCFNDRNRIQNVINENSYRIKYETNQDTLKLLNATNTVLIHRLNMKLDSEQIIEYSIINLDSILIVTIPLELFSSLYLKLKNSTIEITCRD